MIWMKSSIWPFLFSLWFSPYPTPPLSLGQPLRWPPAGQWGHAPLPGERSGPRLYGEVDEPGWKSTLWVARVCKALWCGDLAVCVLPRRGGVQSEPRHRGSRWDAGFHQSLWVWFQPCRTRATDEAAVTMCCVFTPSTCSWNDCATIIPFPEHKLPRLWVPPDISFG